MDIPSYALFSVTRFVKYILICIKDQIKFEKMPKTFIYTGCPGSSWQIVDPYFRQKTTINF